jgi:dihydroorotase-like cyclic amidohydrolase
LIIIGTDNAPHTIQEKLSKGCGGLPSNQHMVPVVLTLAKQLGLNMEKVANLLCLNAASFFGIPVAGEIVAYRLGKGVVNANYNNGVVANPWTGAELYFPVPIEE